MALHPQAQVICDATAAAPRVVLGDETLLEQRAGFGMLLLLAGEAEPVFAVEDHDADGVPARVYRPSPDPGLPVVVYLHGGGWTIGTVEQFDPVLRQIANVTNAVVVAPDYRLAPEHPFPAPLDDCWTAVQWSAKHASELGGDPSRLAVMGDSAGGNLSAVCALMARDAGGPDLTMQVLIYPVTDAASDTVSYRDNAEGYLLTRDQMQWFYDCYLRSGADPFDWRISPLQAADLTGVAPALIITAEYDPLRDEGEEYARRLRDAGVAVDQYRYDGMIHGFFGLSAGLDAGRDAIERAGTALQRAFGTLST
jgi:acetyl esterase